MDYHYKLIQTIEGPRYVLHNGDSPIGKPLKEVAICYDQENGVMHKHGDFDSVTAWFEKTRTKLIEGGFEAMAVELVTVSGEIPIEEINKILSTSGYCKVYFDRVFNEMQEQAQRTNEGSAAPAP